MAVTVAQFLADFPEFNVKPGDATYIAYIQSYLDRATNRTPAETWRHLQDEGIKYLAAHLLALTPWGKNAKLSSSTGTSTYGEQRAHLNKVIAPTPMVC